MAQRSGSSTRPRVSECCEASVRVVKPVVSTMDEMLLGSVRAEEVQLSCKWSILCRVRTRADRRGTCDLLYFGSDV